MHSFTRFAVVVICAVLIVLVYPHQLFSDPAANAQSYGPGGKEAEVFQAAIDDFAVLSSLLQDVSYHRDSVYPVVNRAKNLSDAVNYLQTGFDGNLAESIANCYLGWDEQLSKLVVIPTESVPLITVADQDQTKISFINDHHAVLQRIYKDVYDSDDAYTYTIHMQKNNSGWIICDLSLDEL